LIDCWEMLKETITNPSEGGLVRLKYTFRFGDQFIEPDDDWLKCVENTSDELLGAYSKSEDNALSAAFGSRKKKRLNRVFDAIGFVYPDYRYPPRGQKRKGAASGKVAASGAPSEPAPKRKKLKVLTHRPRYIEPNIVPEFGGETSPAIEAKGPGPTQRIEEPAAMPKTDKIEEPRIEGTKTLEVLSPSAGVEVPKTQKGLAGTPKRKRMASVLDVLETIKASSSTPGKVAKASKAQDDFLYCLPDNKELSVCQEMARSMGFPKLEAGLCAMTKDDLADSLAYNSLKVQRSYIWKFMSFELFFYSYINPFILFI
jgi:hypothetical protein